MSSSPATPPGPVPGTPGRGPSPDAPPGGAPATKGQGSKISDALGFGGAAKESVGSGGSSVPIAAPGAGPTREVKRAFGERLEGTEPVIDPAESQRSATPWVPSSPIAAAATSMVSVPAGEFLFGEERRVERLASFEIDRDPVTNGEYEVFVLATGHRPPLYWKGPRCPDDLREHPVVGVDYFDAMAYARWAGKDLPYEDEWERAARGTDGRLYPWGDEPDLAANTARTGLKMTVPVGFFPKNVSPVGCRDLVGNAWELTHTPAPGGGVVVRGGSWFDFALYAKTTFRLASRPDSRNGTIGFRCVRRPAPRVGASRAVPESELDGAIATRRGKAEVVDASRFSPERRDLVPDVRRLRQAATARDEDAAAERAPAPFAPNRPTIKRAFAGRVAPEAPTPAPSSPVARPAAPVPAPMPASSVPAVKPPAPVPAPTTAAPSAPAPVPVVRAPVPIVPAAMPPPAPSMPKPAFPPAPVAAPAAFGATLGETSGSGSARPPQASPSFAPPAPRPAPGVLPSAPSPAPAPAATVPQSPPSPAGSIQFTPPAPSTPSALSPAVTVGGLRTPAPGVLPPPPPTAAPSHAIPLGARPAPAPIQAPPPIPVPAPIPRPASMPPPMPVPGAPTPLGSAPPPPRPAAAQPPVSPLPPPPLRIVRTAPPMPESTPVAAGAALPGPTPIRPTTPAAGGAAASAPSSPSSTVAPPAGAVPLASPRPPPADIAQRSDPSARVGDLRTPPAPAPRIVGLPPSPVAPGPLPPAPFNPLAPAASGGAPTAAPRPSPAPVLAHPSPSPRVPAPVGAPGQAPAPAGPSRAGATPFPAVPPAPATAPALADHPSPLRLALLVMAFLAAAVGVVVLLTKLADSGSRGASDDEGARLQLPALVASDRDHDVVQASPLTDDGATFADLGRGGVLLVFAKPTGSAGIDTAQLAVDLHRRLRDRAGLRVALVVPSDGVAGATGPNSMGEALRRVGVAGDLLVVVDPVGDDGHAGRWRRGHWKVDEENAAVLLEDGVEILRVTPPTLSSPLTRAQVAWLGRRADRDFADRATGERSPAPPAPVPGAPSPTAPVPGAPSPTAPMDGG